MPIELQFPVTMADARNATGYSDSYLRQKDDELEPIRTANGQRRYSVEAIQRFLAKRGR
jgi:hypothetical protein